MLLPGVRQGVHSDLFGPLVGRGLPCILETALGPGPLWEAFQPSSPGSLNPPLPGQKSGPLPPGWGGAAAGAGCLIA